MQSNNGDGTYTNSMISADFPEPDVILVDDVYYFASTTMFDFPGPTILKSKLNPISPLRDSFRLS
jgi:beta-xylosidase